MNDIELGPCTHLVLLGGGKSLIDIAQQAAIIGYVVQVVTSPRHADEIIENGLTLEKMLSETHIDSYSIVKDIKNKKVSTQLKLINDNAFYLSLGAAWIFEEPYIKDVFSNKLFNLHGTRLPQNRGGGGFSWQIMMGNRFGFCQLHIIDGGIDTGSIVEHQEFIYPFKCRIPSDYISHYRKKNVSFILKVLNQIRNENVTYTLIKQNEYLSTYWPRLNDDIGSWIDWSLAPEKIERFICAFDDPYSGARTLVNGCDVRLKKVHVNYQDGVFHPYQSGIIYRKGPGWICVAVDGASLVVEEVNDNNGNSYIDSIAVGDILYTPQTMLENNKSRVNYTATGLRN